MSGVKKLAIIVVAVFALSFMIGSVALANNGPHGNYTVDTDQCAGCHRAHTADSGVTWVDSQGGARSALLYGAPSSVMTDYCYTCHGDGAPGAGTDVQNGIFDSSQGTLYAGDSVTDGTLNGGGFDMIGGSLTGSDVESSHVLDANGIYAWGDTKAYDSATHDGGTTIWMDCTSCHDPHGSSNYRILNDTVNGNKVGGYNGSNATPWVISAETGYPGGNLTTGGFDLDTLYPGYDPNYTTQSLGNDTSKPNKNMSGWCGACHGAYMLRSSAYDAGDGANGVWVDSVTRHRHPVNVTVWAMSSDAGAARVGDREINITIANQETRWGAGNAIELPLEDNVSFGTQNAVDSRDVIGCLTCHRAHGTEATMTGWADAALDTDNGGNVVIEGPNTNTGSDGVSPSNDGALLRADNRGVCERCHNK